MLALNQQDTKTRPAEETGELIYIPQKCYGILNIDTPNNIKGLYTLGLNTCSGIVAIAKSEDDKSIYFCHADTMTNLLDNNHGLPGWISKLPSSISTIELIYDDVVEGHFKEVISQVKSIASPNNAKEKILARPRENSSVDMVVLRDGTTYCGGGIMFDFEDKGYSTNDETSMIKYCGNLVRYHENPEAPICVFDGIKVLNENELYANHSWLRNAITRANAMELRDENDLENKTEEVSTIKLPGFNS
ncbi:MAG TPA: hypothetical protein VHA13_04440 [Gammaproteobacteria bacterium]|nr:hypothetical protein [Gammaproteobacteria bacterium]